MQGLAFLQRLSHGNLVLQYSARRHDCCEPIGRGLHFKGGSTLSKIRASVKKFKKWSPLQASDNSTCFQNSTKLPLQYLSPRTHLGHIIATPNQFLSNCEWSPTTTTKRSFRLDWKLEKHPVRKQWQTISILLLRKTTCLYSCGATFDPNKLLYIYFYAFLSLRAQALYLLFVPGPKCIEVLVAQIYHSSILGTNSSCSTASFLKDIKNKLIQNISAGFFVHEFFKNKKKMFISSFQTGVIPELGFVAGGTS